MNPKDWQDLPLFKPCKTLNVNHDISLFYPNKRLPSDIQLPFNALNDQRPNSAIMHWKYEKVRTYPIKQQKNMCCKLFFSIKLWRAFSLLNGLHQWNAPFDLYVLATHVSRHKLSLKTLIPSSFSAKHTSVSVSKLKPPTLWAFPKLSHFLSRPLMIIP